jgi:hypothetical protein
MNMNWKKNLAVLLSLLSFFGSLISLAIFFYGNTHPIWVNEQTLSFLGWLSLIVVLSGIIAVILIIALPIPNMRIYMLLSILGIIISAFVGIPTGITNSLAHQQIG